LEKVEHLILSSNFNRWAGPNNHLLDLCNFLYQNLKVDLLFITHDAPIERTFDESINFPLLKILQGSKPTITFMLRSNEIKDPFEANLPFSALKNSALLLRWVRGPLRNSSHPIGGSLRA
jgi:hypothetical protein